MVRTEGEGCIMQQNGSAAYAACVTSMCKRNKHVLEMLMSMCQALSSSRVSVLVVFCVNFYIKSYAMQLLTFNFPKRHFWEAAVETARTVEILIERVGFSEHLVKILYVPNIPVI
jgi:hypothetical protein